MGICLSCDGSGMTFDGENCHCPTGRFWAAEEINERNGWDDNE